jgi:hypothetical protein
MYFRLHSIVFLLKITSNNKIKNEAMLLLQNISKTNHLQRKDYGWRMYYCQKNSLKFENRKKKLLEFENTWCK